MNPSHPIHREGIEALMGATGGVCTDLLGVHDRTSWTGQWRMRPKEAPELRRRIEELVFGSAR